MTIRKTYAAAITQLGPRQIRATISTPDVDMTGEVVVQTGADLSVYKRNPIVLFGHDPLHPVGTASNIRMCGPNLCADIEFAPAGLSKKADETCALVKAGILRGVSIGFDPISMVPMDAARPRGPQRYLSWRLCEISVVAIPANPNAIITDKALKEATMKTRTPRRTPTEMKRRVADLARKGNELAGGGSASRTEAHAGRLIQEGQPPAVARAAAHAAEVARLQRAAHPTESDKLMTVEKLAKKVRPPGY